MNLFSNYFEPDLVVVGTEAVSAFSTSSLTSKSSERMELKDRFRISRKLKLSDFSIFGLKNRRTILKHFCLLFLFSNTFYETIP